MLHRLCPWCHPFECPFQGPRHLRDHPRLDRSGRGRPHPLAHRARGLLPGHAQHVLRPTVRWKRDPRVLRVRRQEHRGPHHPVPLPTGDEERARPLQGRHPEGWLRRQAVWRRRNPRHHPDGYGNRAAMRLGGRGEAG